MGIHPSDVTTVHKLQGIFSHSDRNITLHYIGITREDEIKLDHDMGTLLLMFLMGKSLLLKIVQYFR